MGITAKELARKLNLSAAAVSMALNHKPGVSTATRQLVLDASEKYGYDFSRIAEKHTTSGAIILLSIKNMEQLLQIPRFSLRFPREFHRDAKRMTIV